MQFILNSDYRLCVTLIIHRQLCGYKVEEKLHLGIREEECYCKESVKHIHCAQEKTPKHSAGDSPVTTFRTTTEAIKEHLGSVPDRLCGLLVRVLGYRSGGPGSIPGTTRKRERGPLSLVSTTEELLNRNVAAPFYKTENTAVGIRHADHVAPSIRKSCGRSVRVVRSRTQTMEFVCWVRFHVGSCGICD
jgi:hypothetical protein